MIDKRYHFMVRCVDNISQRTADILYYLHLFFTHGFPDDTRDMIMYIDYLTEDTIALRKEVEKIKENQDVTSN